MCEKGWLFEAYGINPVAADAKYKGKIVEVFGYGHVGRSTDGRNHFGYIIAFPVPGTRAQIASLSPREQKWFRDGAYPPNIRVAAK